jgi:hypothetical protein
MKDWFLFIHHPSLMVCSLLRLATGSFWPLWVWSTFFWHPVKNRKHLFISETDGQFQILTACKKYTKFVTQKRKPTYKQTWGGDVSAAPCNPIQSPNQNQSRVLGRGSTAQHSTALTSWRWPRILTIQESIHANWHELGPVH